MWWLIKGQDQFSLTFPSLKPNWLGEILIEGGDWSDVATFVHTWLSSLADTIVFFFVPVVVESIGTWSSSALFTIILIMGCCWWYWSSICCGPKVDDDDRSISSKLYVTRFVFVFALDLVVWFPLRSLLFPSELVGNNWWCGCNCGVLLPIGWLFRNKSGDGVAALSALLDAGELRPRPVGVASPDKIDEDDGDLERYTRHGHMRGSNCVKQK